MRHTWAHYALGAVIVALGIWFYMNFERVTVREEVGFKGEAARDPLLAFKRLVARMGLEARAPRSEAGFSDLPARGALILPRGRGAYSAARAEALRAWVAGGGHLIVQAEPPDMRDIVLDRLRIGRAKADGPFPGTATISLPQERPLKVWLGHTFEIIDREPTRTLFALKDTSGTTVLHLAEGKGHVTVLPSLAFLTNSQIGEHDHAAFAWALIRLVPGTGVVVIAPQFDPPSLFEWLGENARAALIALTAALIVWAWRAATRFGPVEPEPTRERRRLLDHLRASGRFLWRSGAESKLIAAARETCMQKIARTRPALIELQPGERAERLAELTDLPRRDILHALVAEPETPAAFTAAVATLQQIEEKLTRKPTGSR